MSLAVLIVSLAIAWITSGLKAAVLTVERLRVERAAGEGNARAQALLRLLDNPFRAVAPLTFFFTLALIGLTLGLVWNAFETYQEPFPRITEIVGVYLILLVGKVVVDLFATSRAFGVSMGSVYVLKGLDSLATPFFNLGTWLTRKARGPRTQTQARERVSPNDFQIIMAQGEEPNKVQLIDPDERVMIAGIIEMGKRYASELMIPRPDVVALEASATMEDALAVAIEHGHSRLPVYQEDIDHVVGILHVKDLLQAMLHPHAAVNLSELLRPVHYVPETARADDILRDLLRLRKHMAVVVDEYGGTSGVLTIEDVIEEIVGEIRDEYDDAEALPFTHVGENEALFDGSISVTDFNEEFQTELSTKVSDTLGGLIYAQLGRLPRVGDQVRLGNVELTVTSVEGRRIQQVRALRLAVEPQTVVAANETT